MKTLIIYTTTHGCTGLVVQQIAAKLNGHVKTVDIRKEPEPELKQFGRVIIGGSIHAGKIQKRIRDYCISNLETLKSKELGLFICCMYENEIALEQLKNSFPEELHQYAKTEAILGGEFNFEKMNFLEKLMVRKIANINESISKIDQNAITKFVSRMEKTFQPFMFLV